MADWEAAIVAYIILAMAAETGAAEIAVFIAWGLAVEQVIEATQGQNWLGQLVGNVPWPGFKQGAKS